MLLLLPTPNNNQGGDLLYWQAVPASATDLLFKALHPRRLGMAVAGLSGVLLAAGVLCPDPVRDAVPMVAQLGHSTALCFALLGLAQSGNRGSRLYHWSTALYALCLLLALTVLVQSATNYYPADSLLRVLLNTGMSESGWSGRMSVMTATVLALYACSGLILRHGGGKDTVLAAVAIGAGCFLGQAALTGHIVAVTLFEGATPVSGVLSLPTSVLLTLTGLSMASDVTTQPVFVAWENNWPGQGVFVKVLALLLMLIINSAVAIVGIIQNGAIGAATIVLVLLLTFGMLVIYQQIVSMVEARLAMERALREREQLLAQAQTQASLGSWRLQLPDEQLHWSDECYRIFGIQKTSAPLSYDDFMAAIHPADRAYVEHSWQRALGGDPYDIEHRIFVGDQVRWVRERADLEKDDDGHVVGGVGTVQDITAIKEKEMELLQSREQVRRLAAHNEKIRESERGRIARDLHDDMGQYLTALRLDTALIEMKFAAQDVELAAMLADVKRSIDTTIGVVRDVASSLRPLALDVGFISSAEWLVAGFTERTGIACNLNVMGIDDHPEEGLKTCAFRVLQESLTNVLKHARASRVSVRIAIEAGELTISVRDNGAGFDPARVKAGQHFGLMGIRERVLMFGGTTIIESEPGKGTTLSVVIPIEPGDKRRG